eukprot:UN19378
MFYFENFARASSTFESHESHQVPRFFSVEYST